MFEEYYASEGDTETYSDEDIDRFNLYLEERLTGMNLDPDTDHDQVIREVKYLSDMYLTCDPEEWPF
ncbi:MAG: hypothetical protein V1897_19190 [Pseudomonadota bacterium]